MGLVVFFVKAVYQKFCFIYGDFSWKGGTLPQNSYKPSQDEAPCKGEPLPRSFCEKNRQKSCYFVIRIYVLVDHNCPCLFTYHIKLLSEAKV